MRGTKLRRDTNKLDQMPCGNSEVESQRDSGLKPRHARNELPWESVSHTHNPKGVVAGRERRGTTPLGLGTFASATQGSSCLATLGCEAQSRWDWRSGRLSLGAALSSTCDIRRALGPD